MSVETPSQPITENPKHTPDLDRLLNMFDEDDPSPKVAGSPLFTKNPDAAQDINAVIPDDVDVEAFFARHAAAAEEANRTPIFLKNPPAVGDIETPALGAAAGSNAPDSAAAEPAPAVALSAPNGSEPIHAAQPHAESGDEEKPEGAGPSWWEVLQNKLHGLASEGPPAEREEDQESRKADRESAFAGIISLFERGKRKIAENLRQKGKSPEDASAVDEAMRESIEADPGVDAATRDRAHAALDRLSTLEGLIDQDIQESNQGWLAQKATKFGGDKTRAMIGLGLTGLTLIGNLTVPYGGDFIRFARAGLGIWNYGALSSRLFMNSHLRKEIPASFARTDEIVAQLQDEELNQEERAALADELRVEIAKQIAYQRQGIDVKRFLHTEKASDPAEAPKNPWERFVAWSKTPEGKRAIGTTALLAAPAVLAGIAPALGAAAGIAAGAAKLGMVGANGYSLFLGVKRLQEMDKTAEIKTSGLADPTLSAIREYERVLLESGIAGETDEEQQSNLANVANGFIKAAKVHTARSSIQSLIYCLPGAVSAALYYNATGHFRHFENGSKVALATAAAHEQADGAPEHQFVQNGGSNTETPADDGPPKSTTIAPGTGESSTQAPDKTAPEPHTGGTTAPENDGPPKSTTIAPGTGEASGSGTAGGKDAPATPQPNGESHRTIPVTPEERGYRVIPNTPEVASEADTLEHFKHDVTNEYGKHDFGEIFKHTDGKEYVYLDLAHNGVQSEGALTEVREIDGKKFAFIQWADLRNRNGIPEHLSDHAIKIEIPAGATSVDIEGKAGQIVSLDDPNKYYAGLSPDGKPIYTTADKAEIFQFSNKRALVEEYFSKLPNGKAQWEALQAKLGDKIKGDDWNFTTARSGVIGWSEDGAPEVQVKWDHTENLLTGISGGEKNGATLEFAPTQPTQTHEELLKIAGGNEVLAKQLESTGFAFQNLGVRFESLRITDTSPEGVEKALNALGTASVDVAERLKTAMATPETKTKLLDAVTAKIHDGHLDRDELFKIIGIPMQAENIDELKTNAAEIDLDLYKDSTKQFEDYYEKQNSPWLLSLKLLNRTLTNREDDISEAWIKDREDGTRIVSVIMNDNTVKQYIVPKESFKVPALDTPESAK